jgi:hypothetical protein
MFNKIQSQFQKRLHNFLKGGAIGLLFQGTVVPVTFQPLESSSQSPMLSGFFGSSDLPGLFNALFTTALSVGAILAVLRLAYAGWLYMSSDAFGKKSDAKEVIRDAILGLLLLMGIYIILYQINPNILNLNILQDIGGSGSSAAAATGAAGTVPAGTNNSNGTIVNQFQQPVSQ